MPLFNNHAQKRGRLNKTNEYSGSFFKEQKDKRMDQKISAILTRFRSPLSGFIFTLEIKHCEQAAD